MKTPVNFFLLLFLLSLFFGCTPITETPIAIEEEVQDEVQYTAIPRRAEAEGSGDWAFRRLCGNVSTCTLTVKRNVELLNTFYKKNLTYGERKYGINLVWTEEEDNAIEFAKDSEDRIIHYGDIVAIRVSRGGWLKYKSRDYGINLVWAEKPAYQWEITGGPHGQAVRSSDQFDLYNHVADSKMIYCTRTYGINLRWEKDCTARVDLLNKGPFTTTIYMNRQPIVSGFIPYFGQFGPIHNGAVIEKIVFPTQFPPVSLVKPGRTTNDCGNADAVVVVHGEMTDEQKKAVFGTSNPSISGIRNMPFVGCSPGANGNILEMLPVNITWSKP